MYLRAMNCLRIVVKRVSFRPTNTFDSSLHVRTNRAMNFTQDDTFLIQMLVDYVDLEVLALCSLWNCQMLNYVALHGSLAVVLPSESLAACFHLSFSVIAERIFP